MIIGPEFTLAYRHANPHPRVGEWDWRLSEYIFQIDYERN